ncbi:YjbG polysaccharide synthesis-related protein [Photobacterium marinum]|uniref:YjbG polysaccharide synthesis-related protein n=2 Tax=Photobacterium marinum TaxID=1056511 RepID=L8J4X7_9GAMM|nr:YjbG polysaccharide synthesis-related protein [Photobacterium marinum]
MAEPIEVQVTASAQYNQHLKLSYPAPVRLQQVLADSIANLQQLPLPPKHNQKKGNTDQIYWPGAALLTARSNPEQKAVLAKLNTLSTIWQNEGRNAVLNLKTWLKNEPIGQRVFNSLDYDLVRIEMTQNPLISEDVAVVLPPRPNSVWLLGAVKQPEKLQWRERSSAQRYLEKITPLSNSDNSSVWVIQPDGIVEKHPIAYWNKEHMDIAPGAIIYLGFAALPDDLDSLNEELINLLRNRTL